MKKLNEFKITKKQMIAGIAVIGAVVGGVVGLKVSHTDRYMFDNLPQNVRKILKDVCETYDGKRACSIAVAMSSDYPITLADFGEVGKDIAMQMSIDLNTKVTHLLLFSPDK